MFLYISYLPKIYVVEPIDFLDPYGHDDYHIIEPVMQIKTEKRKSSPAFIVAHPNTLHSSRKSRQHFSHNVYKHMLDWAELGTAAGESVQKTDNTIYTRNPFTNMFHCELCPLVFELRRNLRRHMLTHTNERPFSCDFCEKTFKRKDNLQKHIRDVHAEKNFNCNTCNKKFATYNQLGRHRKTSLHQKLKNEMSEKPK